MSQDEEWQAELLEPLDGGNQNLRAQRGVLFQHDWQTKDLWRLSYEHAVEPGAIIVEESIDSQLTRALRPG